MNSIWKYFAVLALFVLIFAIFGTNHIWACSGPRGTIDNDLIRFGIVVKAQVLEMDDLNQSGIIRIETYLAGGPGPEYLLLSRNSPSLITGLFEGRYGAGDCNGFFASLHPGETVYLLLSRAQRGSYHSPRLFSPDFYKFSSPESTVTVYRRDENLEDIELELSESEFVDLISDLTSENPVEPEPGSPYPLKAPVIITTSRGTAYLVPIDGQPPLEITHENYQDILPASYFHYVEDEISSQAICTYPDCMVPSPNGLDYAAYIDENTITLGYEHATPGQAFLFSTTSDAIAIWSAATLEIHRFYYPRLNTMNYEPELFASRVLNVNSSRDILWLRGRAAWSPDGRLLAYSDADGLWLWDVFNLNSPPRLLIATATSGDIPYARYFSPLGRYLAIGQGSTLETLDLVAGSRLPDGIISPDDRNLLAYDTSAEILDLQICQLAPFTCDSDRVIEDILHTPTGDMHRLDQVKQVEWIDRDSYLALVCNADEPLICAVSLYQTAAFGWWDSIFSEGYLFDYDHENNTLITVADRTTISIDGRQWSDLSLWLDGDIVSVEWLPSLFYRE